MHVTVVGAGIVGLTCALRLAENGHRVSIVAAEPPERTTSAVAAALWYPYRALPEAEVTRWSARTYEVLAELASTPGTGVRLQQGRELFRSTTPDPWWRDAVPALDRIPPGRLPPGYADGLRLTVPVIDMSRHLPWLAGRLATFGVGTAMRRLRSLDEATSSADVVVNCTGLGGRRLLPDPTLTPVRGQVVVIEQVGLTEWLLADDDQRELTYVIPREDTVVLGGTAEEGDDDLTPRAETAAKIIERCAALVPAVAHARDVAHRVGLRPGRPTVRLESQAYGGKPVIHCYGHGGSGVTLSYGCADDVVRLVSGTD